jgi:hypothetical protein
MKLLKWKNELNCLDEKSKIGRKKKKCELKDKE